MNPDDDTLPATLDATAPAGLFIAMRGHAQLKRTETFDRHRLLVLQSTLTPIANP